jgi:hypothetical protein
MTDSAPKSGNCVTLPRQVSSRSYRATREARLEFGRFRLLLRHHVSEGNLRVQISALRNAETEDGIVYRFTAVRLTLHRNASVHAVPEKKAATIAEYARNPLVSRPRFDARSKVIGAGGNVLTLVPRLRGDQNDGTIALSKCGPAT